MQAAFAFCGADETRGQNIGLAVSAIACATGGGWRAMWIWRQRNAMQTVPTRYPPFKKQPALSPTGCRLLFWVCSELVSYPAEEEVGLPLPPKSSLHFAGNVPIQYAGCFFKFAANLSPLPWERVRVRAFSDGANFNFYMAAGLPSPTGEGVSLLLPSEGGLHLNMTAKCRLPLPRAATLSVGMAAQRHADRSDSEIYSRLKLQ